MKPKEMEKEGPGRKPFVPLEPHSIEETGLNLGFLADLVIKIIYFKGSILGHEIAQTLGLAFPNIVEDVLEFLRREQLCEVKGSRGFEKSSFEYIITLKGGEKAREALERSQYVGEAPVPLACYYQAIIEQSLLGETVHEDKLRSSLAHLVLSEEMFNKIGPAVNSGRSIFLFGPTGNGKTMIAEAICNMFGGQLYIPYALEVDGQIIKVFDAVNHQRIETSEDEQAKDIDVRRKERYDHRWVRIKRPFIIAGGELALSSLSLIYHDGLKYYEAPFQMKANGGVFVIDDFGRQREQPRDLLNRWTVPLEKKFDYLTLRTGKKIQVPFDTLIIFSTNLDPKQLVDEAFLRRIRHKIEIGDPTEEQYRQILKRVCAHKQVPYDEEALKYLLKEYYQKYNLKMRSCHPRDLVEELVDIARYLDIPAKLTKDLLERACTSYFSGLI